MRAVLARFLIRPSEAPAWSLPRWCLLAWPLCTLPAAALSALAYGLAAALGLDTAAHAAPQLDPFSTTEWLGAVLLAPMLETALLMLGLRALAALGLRPASAVALSALLWALLHGAFGALWFFGPLWAFWVFGWAVVGWQARGPGAAFLAAFCVHALHNAGVLLFVAKLPA